MAAHGLKDFAGSKAPKFGHFIVEFATPGIGHILKSAGCDFVLFDLEHSGFGFETVKSAIRYFEAADLPVIIRAPSKDYHNIAGRWTWARRADAAHVGPPPKRVTFPPMKYTPEGGRGVALQVSHDRYRPGSAAEKFTAATDGARCSARLRRPKVRRTERSRRCPVWIASGSAISIFGSPAYPANSAPRSSPTLLRALPLPRPNTASPWVG
jgi:hypothetical protein